MLDIEDFVEDITGDLGDKIQAFLEERDRIYQERAKLGVQISKSWNGYDALIGGHGIRIEHDTSMHRWRFKDENYHTFFILSEKKGEAVVRFLKELAKILSPRAAAASEEINEKILEDPAAKNDEIIAGAAADPESSGEENIEEGRII